MVLQIIIFTIVIRRFVSTCTRSLKIVCRIRTACAPVALTTSAVAAPAAALEDVPATPPGTFSHFLLDPLALNYRTCQNVKNLSVYACAERTIPYDITVLRRRRGLTHGGLTKCTCGTR